MTHLHVHTSKGSLLDSLIKLDDLRGQDTVAITDHGVVVAILEFYKNLNKVIPGVEIYYTPDRKQKDRESYHLVLLAQNLTGYKNILKLVSKSFEDEYFYYKNRTDLELLLQYNEGLIVLSGCLSSYLLSDDNNLQYFLDVIKDVFKDRFYVEIQPNRLEDQIKGNERLVEIASSYGFPLVTTCDVHYAKADDAETHDIAICIDTKKRVRDKVRKRYGVPDFWLMDEATVRDFYARYHVIDSKAVDVAIENTDYIAHLCDVEIPLGQNLTIQIPDAELLLEAECFAKLPNKQNYWDRLNYELGIINRYKYSSYFLICKDIVDYCRRNGIWYGWGRGSAAGSLVCYLLGITKIDPIKYGLMFERFLAPEGRVDVPDIDIDIEPSRREEVIGFLREKYGYVVHIATYGEVGLKSAIRGVGRALDISYPDIDMLVRRIEQGEHVSDKKYEQVIHHANKLVGCYRTIGQHAGGIVLTHCDVTDYVAIFGEAAGKIVDRVVAQADLDDIESLGLLKLDLLGISNLQMMKECCQQAGLSLGQLEQVEPDDPKVFNNFRVSTCGIFQLEGAVISNLCRTIQVKNLFDLAAINALGRPGPMSKVQGYIESKPHPYPQLNKLLEKYHYQMLYQESLLEVVQKICGFSFAEADSLRRVIAKKKVNEFAVWRDKIISSCSYGEYIWSLIEPCIGYLFNLSHAVAYSFLGYLNMYLKTYYPIHYMCALLNSVINTEDWEKKIKEYYVETRRLGIQVVPPSLESRGEFTVEGNKILWGLSALRGVGSVELHPPYQDWHDFLVREKLPKKTLEAFVYAGVFDSWGPRGVMLRKIADGENNLLLYDDAVATLGHTPTPAELKAKEIEVVGVDLHCAVPEIIPPEHEGYMEGILVDVRCAKTKAGADMAFCEISDGVCSYNLVFFPSVFKKYASVLSVGNMVRAKVRAQEYKGNVSYVVNALELRDHIILKLNRHTDLGLLKECLENFPGPCPVYVQIYDNGIKTIDLNMSCSWDMVQELKEVYFVDGVDGRSEGTGILDSI